jgi:protein SCO1
MSAPIPAFPRKREKKSEAPSLARSAGKGWGGWWRFATMLIVATLLCCNGTVAGASPLPRIGPAPSFSLTTQDKQRLKLSDLRGKVVAVTFIFTACKDTCPVLTAKLVNVQRKLAAENDRRVAFVAITLTPQDDTPEVLKAYANAHGADLSRWAFLTGEAEQIGALARQYGVYVKREAAGNEVDHGFLTSLVDRKGVIRVQYMGVRFEMEEMLADLRALTREAASP